MPSSVIKHYYYDKDKEILTITFVTEMVYQYIEVPEKTYKLFRGAVSKGKFFNYHIKDKFKFKKIED